MFKVPSWYFLLWEGNLFGKRKDKLMLRILKLGGKDLLISQCGLPLDSDKIIVAQAPSLKLLSSVLRAAAAQKKELDKGSSIAEARAKEVLAHPEDFKIEKTTLINREDLRCDAVIWTPKKPGAKRQKK